MKNKQNNEELRNVGDFTITAEDGKTVVNLVTGHDYAGSRRINTNVSDPHMNTVVARWQPRIEAIPEDEVVAKIDSISARYNVTATKRCNSCIELDARDYAYTAVNALEQAKTELKARKGI